MMCVEQREISCRLNPRVFANNNVKFHYFYHDFYSHKVCIHTWGEVDNFYATHVSLTLYDKFDGNLITTFNVKKHSAYIVVDTVYNQPSAIKNSNWKV